ncbi:MAG TPA: hypothetical protein VHT02_10470 [Methylocella sp.]|nr:hypothetical protein [Methylocella sp.]
MAEPFEFCFDRLHERPQFRDLNFDIGVRRVPAKDCVHINDKVGRILGVGKALLDRQNFFAAADAYRSFGQRNLRFQVAPR